jgi:hypothetical protein
MTYGQAQHAIAAERRAASTKILLDAVHADFAAFHAQGSAQADILMAEWREMRNAQ